MCASKHTHATLKSTQEKQVLLITSCDPEILNGEN